MSLPLIQETGLVNKVENDRNEIIGIDNLKSSGSQKRIPELDGLRGIAVLMVISFHYINNQLYKSDSFVGRLIYKMTSFGWVGVDLFFVLSGFLIGTILMNNKGTKKYFQTFYIRRVVRIIPNYYLLIALFAIISFIPSLYADNFFSENDVIPIWVYLLMVHNFFVAHLKNFGNTPLSPTWSIGVEEQFYIIFPFLVYLLKTKWIPWLLVLAIILAPILRMQYDHWLPPYVLLPCRMDSIAFGALIAYINHRHSLSAVVKKYIVPIISILVLDILICAYCYARYNDLGVYRNSLFAIAFSGMIVFALVYKDSLYGSILRFRKLVWIGTISYSLYLFHELLLGLCRHFLNGGSENRVDTLKGAIITLIALILSIAFSRLVFKRLETPFVNFGKRFKYQ